MSKKQLEKALADAIKNTEKYRERTVDKYEHYYYVDVGTITREALNAVQSFLPSTVAGKASEDGSLSKIRSINAGMLREPVSKYVKRLYAGFKSSPDNSSVLFDVRGSIPTFVVRCYENPKTSGRTRTVKSKEQKSESVTINLQANFYRAINKVRTKNTDLTKFKEEKDISISNMSPLDELRASVLEKLFNIVVTDTTTASSSGITNQSGKDLFDVVLGGTKKGKREGGLFHLGHLEGFAVVEKRALDIYTKVTQEIGVTLGSASLEKILNSKKQAIAKSKIGQFLATIDLPEEFTIVMDENATANMGKVQEQLIIEAIKTELLANDWAQQEGSMKPISAVVYDLQETMEESLKSLKPKRSRKVKGKRNSGPTKTKSIPIKGTAKVTRTKGNESFPSSTGKAEVSTTGKSRTNWSPLIAIINAKLPERVARNMGSPGLVYRTGRLAESAKVVNVQTTKEGYSSIVFDYQRDPYDVFDRTLGRSPWNTPARDPRALVDRSVREIVQEMAVGRFYTRRA